MTHGLLHELIDPAVRRLGERCAIEIPTSDLRVAPRRMTYAELDAAAERVRRLLAAFVTGECVVAILLPRTSKLLFAAQLGVLRAGAAFVCLDVHAPAERLRFILEDAGVVVILADGEGSAGPKAAQLGAHQVVDVGAPAPADATPLEPDWLTPASLAYVIYTSGTTGRPKGVMIEHRSIVHLIREELAYFELLPSDRCVLVSAPIYDSSIEESWLPFAAGATVIVADDDTTRLGPDLVPWLRAVRATVLMPTPTLLRMTACVDPAAALPELRLVYVGGEAIAEDLVDRWAPGRWLENGYGPTECTVTVVRSRLREGEPAAIGRAIPGNVAWVLDESLRPVVDGEIGELCMAGIGLARGYVNAPALTAERFPTVEGIGRIYRTGDLVRCDVGGVLHYLGRADSQVKVRGYRIELEEIEARMASLEDVKVAACRVSHSGGVDRLEAFYVPAQPGTAPTSEELATRLGEMLPAHMVPTRFAALAELPTTAGGKLDRRLLPASEQTVARDGVAARSPLETAIARALATPLGLESIGIDDDFFALGGDSLGVAGAVSALRRESTTAPLAARDIYEQRTVRRLAEHVRTLSPAREVSGAEPRDRVRDHAHPLLVTVVQTAWLTSVLTAGSFVSYAAVFLALPWLITTLGAVPILLLSPLAAALGIALYAPFALAVAVLTKRALIGRYTARRVPVWSGFYLRHWIVVRMAGLVPWRVLQGTVFYGAALRALGARVGRRVHFHRGVDLAGGGWDLLTIGDDVTLSQDASVGLVRLEDGELVIGPVTLEEGCTLEVRAGVGEHTVVGTRAELSALSYLSSGSAMAAKGRYDGIPARRSGRAADPVRTAARSMDPSLHGVAMIVAELALRAAVAIPGIVIVVMLLVVFGVGDDAVVHWIRAPFGLLRVCFALAAWAGFSLAAGLVTQALLLRWTAAVPAGVIGRWTRSYIRVWLRTGLVDAAGRWLAGSLFWRWWLQLAGMRLGANCEVSTILDVLPEHVVLGDECFFADGVYLCGPAVKRGVVTTAPVEVGARVFVGNHVVIPAGTRLPSDLLIGVATVADGATMRAATSWFGHPAFELPRREVVQMDRRLTHEPSAGLYVHRLAWETLRFAIPAVLVVAALAWLECAGRGWAYAPLASLAVGATLAIAVCALKWALLGRVRPGQHGFWSCWCARWDFLYMAWGMLARGVLSPLGGTLLLPWYLRAMGVRVGRRVVLGGEFAQVVDPDMLEFGDHATIDRPMFQAHSFEDRVLKIDRVVIGRAATVGRATVLFYGARLGAGCRVAPHSVVMKGERLTPFESYSGSPTRPEPRGL